MTFVSNNVYLRTGLNSDATALTIAAGETFTGNFSITAENPGLTLVNQGTINLSSSGNSIYGNTSSFTVTNASGGLLESTTGTNYLGNGTGDVINNNSGGTIAAAGGNFDVGYGSGSVVSNAGTLEATVAGNILTLGNNTGGSWTNTGTIAVSNNGIVDLDGAFTNATLAAGTIDAAGGVVNITGTLTNTTLAAPTTGYYTLSTPGTIYGGTVASGTLVFGNGGTVDDVNVTGNFTIPSGNSLYASDGSVFSGGTMTFVNNYLYLKAGINLDATALTVAAGETLVGNLTIQAQTAGLTLVNNGTININASGNSIYGNSTGFILTNASGGLITATGGSTLYIGNGSTDLIQNNAGATINANGGNINLGYGTGSRVVNTGTVEATSAGSILTLGNATSESWSNTGGSIIASGGGTVDLAGTFVSSDLTEGTINGTGGTVNLVGTVTNTAIAVPDGGGIFTLYGGTINGGTVAGGALTFSNSGGTLNNVTMNGNFSLPTGAVYANFHNTGTTSFTGGTTTFDTASTYDTVYLNTAGQSLDVAASATWTGTFSITGQATGSTFTNEGALDLTANSNVFGGNSNGSVFKNYGTITASGSGTQLYLGDTGADVVTNESTGTITADSGATVTVGYSGASWTNPGTITANAGGAIILSGAYNDASFTGGTFNAIGTGVLELAGTFTNTSGTLAVPATGVYTLYGATITGGTVASGALTFSNSGGTLAGVTMNGNFSLPTGAVYANFHNTGTTSFTGGTTTFDTASTYDTVYLNTAGQSLDVAASATWTGSFSITGQATGSTFTNEGALDLTANSNIFGGNSNGSVFQNYGTITASGAATQLYLGDTAADVVTNESTGTITADSGSTVTMGYSGARWTNAGTITANAGGTVILSGAYNDASFTGGTFNAIGSGVLDLAGTFTNTGGTLAVPATGVYTLYGATITGGTVASGALTFSNSGGTLSGVTMNGNFSLPSGANYANFHNMGTTSFTGGTTTFDTASTYDTVYLNTAGQSLDVAASATWTGSFSITGQATGSTFTNEGTLDLTANSNVFGGNSNGSVFQNYGTIAVSGSGTNLYLGDTAADVVTNESTGTITADSGSTVTMGYSGASWTNAGTITANAGGTVILSGAYNDASFAGGTFNAVGTGVLDLAGTFTNTSGTLAAPATGVYTLFGATITGGTVANGALTFSNSGGTLSGVTMNGNFAMPTGSNYANFHAAGATSFTGGTLTFNSASGYDNVYLTGAGAALTIGASETWNGSFNVTAQTATQTLSNLGTINLVGSSNSITGSNTGFTFTNSGTFTNTSSTVYLGEYTNDTFTDAAGGTVETTGGTIYLGYNGSAVTNLAAGTLTGGTWEALGGGVLSFEGTTPLTTNDATLVINGTSSSIRTKSGTGDTYQTVAQTLATNNGTLEVLGGQNFTATNTVTNNGLIQLGGGTYSGGALTSGAGSSLTGNGTFSPTGGVTVGSGVLVSPGTATANNYVNTLTFSAITLGGGGSLTFDVANASGTAGVDYDTLAVTGTANITASPGTPFTINVESIAPGTGLPGLATFNSSSSYQWTLISSSSLTNFNASDFVINAGSFSNSLGIGSFYVTTVGNDLDLDFTPVPEPSTWALMALGGLAVALVARRRRAASSG
jgi:hypothetical protein